MTSRHVAEAVDAFLVAVEHGQRERALAVAEARPEIASECLHVAAVLGREADVRRLLAEDPRSVATRLGSFGGEPLLWLCHSPFHGENAERDEGLAASARALLEAGADPNTKDRVHGVPALYAVTGVHEVTPIAKMLIEAGAEVNDGESVFHAAERFHEEALDLLLASGTDLNEKGEWGNTPLYFLLRYWDVQEKPDVRRGLVWLLDHGADPNVHCGREQESSLHVAVRRGQHTDIVRLLLERGADPRARSGDGRSAWMLAYRGGFPSLRALLEDAGAPPEEPSAADELLAACGRGDHEAARRLARHELIEALEDGDLRRLPEAAGDGRADVVAACLAAGFPVDTTDEHGATALHHASIHGRAAMVRELLGRGADPTIRDAEHRSTPLGWACYGVDFMQDAEGDYVATVRALLEAGVRPTEHDRASHPGVQELLRAYR